MKLTIFLFSILFLFFFQTLWGQKNNDINKQLLGTWEFDISKDTIATATNYSGTDFPLSSHPIIFYKATIKTDKASVSFDNKMHKGTWLVKEDKYLVISLKNNQVTSYKIISITDHELVLEYTETLKSGQEFSAVFYYKKKE